MFYYVSRLWHNSSMPLFRNPDHQNNSPVEYSEIEHAMSDTLLLQASVEAKNREAYLNAKGSVDEAEIDTHITRLDTMVKHLIDTNAIVRGGIINDEAPVDEEERLAAFKGFHYFFDDRGKIRLDYVMHVATNEQGEALSIAEYLELKEAIGYGKINLFAKVTHVSRDQTMLDFEKIHPTRAQAWLAIAHPELFSELEQLLDDPSKNDPYFEQTLLSLKNLRIDTSDEGDKDHVFGSMLKRCVNAYLETKIKLDKDLPYLIYAPGRRFIKNNGEFEAIDSELFPRSVKEFIVTANKLDLWRVSDDGTDISGAPYVPALFVTHHAKNIKSEGIEMVIPVESLRAIKSMRGLFFSAVDASQGLGKVRKSREE